MPSEKLILVVSQHMDKNKKAQRDEHRLIRCSALARKTMGFKSPIINVGSKASERTLQVFPAYIEDIVRLKGSSVIRSEELRRVGFVTSQVFQQLCGADKPVEKDGYWYMPEAKKTLLGADPEFLLFDEDDAVVRANGLIGRAGTIASDGAMAEIHPEPDANVEIVVENIKSILTTACGDNPLQPYRWEASVYHEDANRDYPVGGHIHFGNPVGITALTAENRNYLFAVTNRILDELLAIPLMLLDGQYPGTQRRKHCRTVLGGAQGYGYYGSWRLCAGRLEYRTLSGMWLAHPQLTGCVLGTAKAIVDEVYGAITQEAFSTKLFIHPKVADWQSLYRPKADFWKDIPLTSLIECTDSSDVMRDIIDNCRVPTPTKSFLEHWHERLLRLGTYNAYAKYIDKLYEILSVPKKQLSTLNVDIKDTWLNNGDLFK